MRVIDAAVRDFADLPMQSVEVDEWRIDDKPVRVYWKPLNMMERAKLFNGGALDITGYAQVLIDKALDEKGNNLFRQEDKFALLRNVDSGPVTRLALAIIAGPDREALEKNSVAIPSAS